MINNCVTRLIRRWGSGAGLAAGTFVTAALTGIGAAHADDLTPADQLSEAAATYTDANGVLSQIDLSLYPDFGSFVNSQIATQDTALTSISQLQSAEAVILANDAPFGWLVNGYFTLFDQEWLQLSAAMLNMDQALATALDNNSVALADIDQLVLYALDFQLFGDALNAFPINFGSLLF